MAILLSLSASPLSHPKDLKPFSMSGKKDLLQERYTYFFIDVLNFSFTLIIYGTVIIFLG